VVGLGNLRRAIDLSRGCSGRASGAIYVSDVELHTVSKFLNGVLTENFAGDGYSGFAGDGGPAANAELGRSRGLGDGQRGQRLHRGSDQHAHSKSDAGWDHFDDRGVTKDGYSGTADRRSKRRCGHPHGVAVDASGNVYIADTEKRRGPPIDPGESRHRRCHQRRRLPAADLSRRVGFCFGTGLSNATYQSAAPYPASLAHPAWRRRGER